MEGSGDGSDGIDDDTNIENNTFDSYRKPIVAVVDKDFLKVM
jgi:hypothetical protein